MTINVVEVSSSNININVSPVEQINITISNTGGSGVTDHGQLQGLADDDHTQYLNSTRGDARYYTQSQINIALGNKEDVGIAASLVSSHANLTNNPHNVTKDQIGLGNADNTSDINKPLSTAAINALAAKARSSGIRDLYSEWSEEFNGSSLTSSNGWGSANSGGTAATLSATITGAPLGEYVGVCIQTLGSAASSRSSVSLPGFFLGNGYVLYAAFRLNLEALATVAEDYWYNIGFNDINNALDCNYGAYLQYNRAVSANWYGCAAKAGLVDKTNTNIAVKAGDTADKIITAEIEVAADASNVKFYLEGVLVATLNSSNIPNGIIPTNLGFKGMRLGTPSVNRSIFIDKIKIARYKP